MEIKTLIWIFKIKGIKSAKRKMVDFGLTTVNGKSWGKKFWF